MVERAPEMTAIDPTAGTGRGKALRTEREASGFVERQVLRAHR